MLALKSFNKNKGFTLTEIMIVLVVLGLLIAVALPRVSQVLVTGKLNSTKTSMSSLSKAVKNFYTDTNIWPGNIKDLMSQPIAGERCYNSKTLAEMTYTASHRNNWKGPYMDGTTKEISVDSWSGSFSIGVVSDASVFTGYDVDGTRVPAKALTSDSYRDAGSVPGYYLFSKGEDTQTSETDDNLVKDDVYVFIASKVQR